MPRDKRVTIQKMTRQETADLIPRTPGELTSKEGLTGNVWINLYWPTEAAELRLWGSWKSSRGGGLLAGEAAPGLLLPESPSSPQLSALPHKLQLWVIPRAAARPLCPATFGL